MTNKKIVQNKKQIQLENLADDFIKQDLLPELRAGARQLVAGDGNPDAQIVFVGEAPGAREDEQGVPFVGSAGNFLAQMLEGIGLNRADVFITNIVKYRPPNNRDPLPDEVKTSLPYLLAQLKVIEPKLVVLLGRHAMNVFFPKLVISQAHGQPVRADGQVFLPLFHPAATLYNGSLRQTLIDDFAIIPKLLLKIESKN